MAGQPRLAFLTRRPFAHRGLHGRGLPENSLAAARAAIARGYGIECDVRPSAEHHPFVFHDSHTERLTGIAGRFSALSRALIAALRLAGGGEAPPDLPALLALTGRRTPLLVEVKAIERPSSIGPACRAIARALRHTGAPVAIMSFDARVVAWFARYRPHVVRGLVTSRRWRPVSGARLSTRLAFRDARPHFIARDVRDLPHAAPAVPLLCWTVRSRRERLAARARGAQIIFER